jgi:4-amino-4-deoxy-L-arabinose transferase-like glycosyltransferase
MVSSVDCADYIVLMPPERPERGATALAWGLAWLVAAALIAFAQYSSRDPDSQLYAGIAARLAGAPLREWIAPEWWGLWGLTGPFTEHPIGLFVLPAALARLGYPAEQAAYAVNAFYQIGSLCLAALIVAAVVPRREARALQWLLQLMPIAFVFRIRANHEYAVLAALLFAVYATERSRARPVWIVGMLAGFCAILLIKGPFAFIVPLACALWLAARDDRSRRAWHAWAAIAAMPLAAALVAWSYEAAYVDVTGRSFLDAYTGRQLPSDQVTAGFSPLRAGYNAVWYLSRILWYAFPWSILAGIVAVRAVWNGQWTPSAEPTRQGAWFAIAATGLLFVAFSLAHRKADRYLIPVYFIIAAVGAVEAIRRFAWLRRGVERLDRPWVPAVFFVVLCALRIWAIGPLRQFTFWRT